MLQSHYWSTSNFSSPKGLFDDDLQKWKGATKDALDYELVQQAALPPESFTKQEVSNYYRKKLSETTDPAERIAWFQRLVENEAAGTEDIVNKKFFSEWIAFLLGKTDPKTVEYKTISETPWHLPDGAYPVGTGYVREGRWKLEEQPPIRRQDEGGKEIRAYINTFTDRHFDFMMKIISLKSNGPKSLNDHWLYFKYIVKGHAKDFGTRPLPELFLDYKDFMDPEKQNSVFTDANSASKTGSGDDTGYSRFIQDDPGTGGPTEPMQHDTGGDKSKNVSESYIQKLYNRYNSKPTTDNIFDAKVLTFTKDLLDKENARKARERLDVEPDPRIKGNDVPYNKPDKDLSAEEREANLRWEKRNQFIKVAETAELMKIKEKQWDYDQKRERDFRQIKKKTISKQHLPDYSKAKKEAKEALKQLRENPLTQAQRKEVIKKYDDAVKIMNTIPPPPPVRAVKTLPPKHQQKVRPMATNPPKPKPAATKSSQAAPPPETTSQPSAEQQQAPAAETSQTTPSVTTTTTQSSATTQPPPPNPTDQTSLPQQSQQETSPAPTQQSPVVETSLQKQTELPPEGNTSSLKKWYNWMTGGADEKKLVKQAAEKLFSGTEITEDHQKYTASFLKFLDKLQPNMKPLDVLRKWDETVKKDKVPQVYALEMVSNFFKDELDGEYFNREKVEILKKGALFTEQIFGVPASKLVLMSAFAKPLHIPTYLTPTESAYLNQYGLAKGYFDAGVDFSTLNPLEQDILSDMYRFPHSAKVIGFKLPLSPEGRIELYKHMIDSTSNLVIALSKHALKNPQLAAELAQVKPAVSPNQTLQESFIEGNITFIESAQNNFRELWKKKEGLVLPPQPSEVAFSKSLESPSPGQ